MCRDRFGVIEVPLFRQRACVLCYRYLFQSHETVDFSYFQLAWRTASTQNESLLVVTPDPTNETSLEEVCQTLRSAEECDRWRQCCMAGKDCCDRQVEKMPPQVVVEAEQDEEQPRCASTWDGYACWDSTPPGTNAAQPCPLFISLAIASRKLVYVCR